MRKILKFTAILLIVAGSFSCGDKEDVDGTVPYAPCDCEKEGKREVKFPKIRLFKSSISPQIEEEVMYAAEQSNELWMLYDSNTETARIYSAHSIGLVCNYPDFAKKWDIPTTGCFVYGEGISSEPCNPPEGIASVTYVDVVLTILKLQ
jgi:hypothetical protein